MTMNFSNKLKGSALALLATLSFSNVYLFSKLAMKDTSLSSFGILWFGIALSCNTLYYLSQTKRKKFGDLPQKSKLILILIGLSELISTSAFFLAIQLTENPAIVSFFANTSPIFVIAIGFLFLKIRYNFLAIIGMVITLSGVGLLNLNLSEIGWESILTPSNLAALIFAFFYGISLVLAKSEIENIPASMLTVCRTLFLFIGFIVYGVVQSEMPHYSLNSFFLITTGAILGPFLGSILTFISLKFIDASVTTLICTSRSLFIVLEAYVFMSILPEANQLLGGSLTILGILIITIGDISKTRKARSQQACLNVKPC